MIKTCKRLFLGKRAAFGVSILGASLLLAACATSDTSSIIDTAWVTEDIEGQGVLDSLQTTMIIAKDNRVTGQGGCNNYFGLADIKGNEFRMGPVGATSMACPEDIMAQEQRFFGALEKARRFEARDKQLFLYDDAGNPVLRFALSDGV